MKRTHSVTAAVFALCMSCSPEPESSTEGGTMPSSGAITCDSLRGALYRLTGSCLALRILSKCSLPSAIP